MTTSSDTTITPRERAALADLEHAREVHGYQASTRRYKAPEHQAHIELHLCALQSVIRRSLRIIRWERARATRT